MVPRIFPSQIPQLEDQLRTDRPPHWEGEEGGGSGDSEGEVTVVVEDAYDHPQAEFVAEQPKLLLADPIEPRPEKEPLPPSLTNSGDHYPSPIPRPRPKNPIFWLGMRLGFDRYWYQCR